MASDATIIESPRDAPKRGASVVWDRVWRHRPSDARDDELLARECRNRRWGSIVDHLEAAFGSIAGLRTVELGSGRGDLSALLARCGAEVTLLDTSSTALDQARHRFDRLGLGAHFVEGDLFATADDWRDGFDVALSSGVIEHFRGHDRTCVIEAHGSVLSPGGMAIISVPHARCVSYRSWKAYLQLRGWWPYGVEIPYTRRELVTRALQAGLSQPDVRGSGLWQSVGSHWVRPLLGRRPDWDARTSLLDDWFGATLTLFARRRAAETDEVNAP